MLGRLLRKVLFEVRVNVVVGVRAVRAGDCGPREAVEGAVRCTVALVRQAVVDELRLLVWRWCGLLPSWLRGQVVASALSEYTSVVDPLAVVPRVSAMGLWQWLEDGTVDESAREDYGGVDVGDDLRAEAAPA